MSERLKWDEAPGENLLRDSIVFSTGVIPKTKRARRLITPKPTIRLMLFFQSEKSSIRVRTKIAGKSFN